MSSFDVYSYNKNCHNNTNYVKCIDCEWIIHQNNMPRHYKNQHKNIQYKKTWRILKQSGDEYK